jgi:hypothetical protein
VLGSCDATEYFERLTVLHMASSAISLTRRMSGSDLIADFKLVKWIKGIEFVADFRDIVSGYGGYSEVRKYFGRHQTL